MLPALSANRSPFSALRQFVRQPSRSAAHRCELCGLALPAQHPHLVESTSRVLVCSCDACAVLFSGQASGRYRRVPQSIESLPEFSLSDQEWDDLHVPINLAFFVKSTVAGRVFAFYPSPAGATESMLELDAWDALTDKNPVLKELEPDVEALLVHRVDRTREYYRAPIDECYKLVGLIRANWRGLSGSAEVWEEVGRFFSDLKERSRPWKGESRA